MASLMDRLRRAIFGEGTPMPHPELTSAAEKKAALDQLAQQRLQLSRLDADVDAYRANLAANRLKRRAGDRR